MARKFTSDDKAKALTALAANNGNIAKTARLLGMPRKTLSEWSNGRNVSTVTSAMIEANAENLADKFEKIADALTDAMADPEKIKKASLQQVAVAAGIATDKSRLLRSLPTSISAKISTSQKEQYERIIAKMIEESSKNGVSVNRDEAINLMEIHLPDIKEVLGVH